ncbi:menaquinone-dependent protoporphyrinogen IX dehydrogenase [Seminibacterium arietis]|uniref:Protoporphyrinogen IX dehydrogenase [quinone] n=1 Tax=Seminibacterium arietis TaxID=1173502 RepID=A0ABW3I9W9_9PAST
MKTLILYSSRNGQTKKIANFIGSQLDHSVTIADLSTAPDLTNYDQIIIGASIRFGHFHKSLSQFVQKNTALLNQKRTAFFSVNLTARKSNKDTPQTNVYTRKFLQKTIWKPTNSAVFAGALYYPRYNWFERSMIRFIMKITGGETDISKEIEYTDWEKVKDFTNTLKYK